MAEGSNEVDMTNPSFLLSRTRLPIDAWGAAAKALLPVLESLKVKLRVQKAREVDFS